MNKYPDFWSIIIGNQPAGFLLGYIVLGIVSAFGMILIMATQRYKNEPGTPAQWSWRYFFADNLGKFIAGLFLIPIFIRLLIEINVNPGWMVLISIGTGFGFLGLAKIATNYGLWTTKNLSSRIAQGIKKNADDK